MNITSRAFGKENDLSRLKSLVTTAMADDMEHSYWHVGDLVWGMYQNTVFDPRQRVHLWEDEQGELVGFAWKDLHGTVFVQVHPHHRNDGALLEQMLA